MFIQLPRQNAKIFLIQNEIENVEQGNLTIWRLTTYIYESYRTANLQTLHFKYFLNKYTY